MAFTISTYISKLGSLHIFLSIIFIESNVVNALLHQYISRFIIINIPIFLHSLLPFAPRNSNVMLFQKNSDLSFPLKTLTRETLKNIGSWVCVLLFTLFVYHWQFAFLPLISHYPLNWRSRRTR